MASHDSPSSGGGNEPLSIPSRDAHAELLRHWEAIRNAPDIMTPDEADVLAAEAVAYVRANK